MKKISYFGYDKFECSNCGNEVDELENYCQICGRRFYSLELVNLKNRVPKFIHKEKKENYYLFLNNGIEIDVDLEYKKQLFKYIKLLRIESYFNYIYRLLYQEDYLKNNVKVEREELLFFYYEYATKILKDVASIILDETIDPYDEYKTSFEWKIHHQNYSIELKYIINAVLDTINYNKELRKTIGVADNENPYYSEKSHLFVNYLITIAYSHATQRIVDDLNSTNYLGIEIFEDKDDEDELIIYLTPKGIMEVATLMNNTVKEDRADIFMQILNKIGVQGVENKELKEYYNAPGLLVFNNKMYRHYKQYDSSYSDYFIKRINRPYMNSIILETQANFRKV